MCTYIYVYIYTFIVYLVGLVQLRWPLYRWAKISTQSVLQWCSDAVLQCCSVAVLQCCSVAVLPPSCTRHDSLVWETCLRHTTCHVDMIYIYIYVYIYVMSQTCLRHMHTLHIHVTGWRRLIGSPKLQIIFHKRATKCRSLLRKMTYKDKGSYESSPPCTCNVCICLSHVCHICRHEDMRVADITPAYEGHDSFMWGTWHDWHVMSACVMCAYVSVMSVTYVVWGSCV